MAMGRVIVGGGGIQKILISMTSLIYNPLIPINTAHCTQNRFNHIFLTRKKVVIDLYLYVHELSFAI